MTLELLRLSTNRSYLRALTLVACSLAAGSSGCSDAQGRDSIDDDRDLNEHDDSTIDSARASVFLPHVAKDRFGIDEDARVLTGIQVQNLSSRANATVHIYFFESSGRPIPEATVTRTLAAGESFTELVHNALPTRTHWFGSAVVQTDEDTPIGVVTNILEVSPDKRGDAYEGIAQPDQRFSIPFVDMRDGVANVLTVQNTTESLTQVEVHMGGRSGSFSLPPRAVQYIDPVALVGGISASAAASGNERPVASAEIRADHDIAVAFASRTPTSMNVYTAPRTGDGLVPLVNFQPPGIDSWIYVQNTAATTRDLEVSYQRPEGACIETVYGVPPQETVDFGWSFSGRGYDGYARDTTCDPGRFVGAAASQPDTATVAVQYTQNGDIEATYAAARLPQFADSTSSGSSVVFPLLMAHNSGWWTGFSVLNASSVPTEVTCEFYGSGDYDDATVDLGLVSPYTATTALQPATFGSRWVGSAVCSGSNSAQLVGVANELLQDGSTNDSLMVYRAFAQQDSPATDHAIEWTGRPAVCGSVRDAWNQAEWMRRPGMVLGVSGSGSAMFGIGAEIGAGTEIVWDFFHHQAAASWWTGGGPVFGPEFNVASAGVEAYAGLALGFPTSVADWYGPYQAMTVGGEITTVVNQLIEAITGVGVGVTVAAQMYGSVDPETQQLVPPWNGGTSGTGLTLGGVLEWGYSVPGLMIPLAGPLGIVPEVTVTAAGESHEFKAMTRALYDQMRSGFIQAPAHLVDPISGADCHAQWPEVDRDTTCVIEFGRRDQSHIERALGSQVGLCKVTGVGSCLSQMMMSVATLNLTTAALHQTGDVLDQYCEG